MSAQWADRLNTIQGLRAQGITLTGAWESTSWGSTRWEGLATGEDSFVALIFLQLDRQVFWAKSSRLQGETQMRIGLDLIGTGRVQFLYSVGHAFNSITDAVAVLPTKEAKTPIPASQALKTGHLFTFATFDSTPPADLYAIFLAQQDIQMRRKMIWRLKAPFLAGLEPPLLDIMLHGRQGRFAF